MCIYLYENIELFISSYYITNSKLLLFILTKRIMMYSSDILITLCTYTYYQVMQAQQAFLGPFQSAAMFLI